MTSPLSEVAIGLIGIGGAGLAFWRGAMELVERHRMKNTPKLPISKVSEGLVEVAGAAHAPRDAPVRAPFSKAHVAYVRWRMDDFVGGRGSKWVTRASGDSGRFIVRDDTGEIAVLPEGADAFLTETVVDETGPGRPASPAIAAWLATQGTSETGIFHMEMRRRFVEVALPEGAPVFVLATCASESDGAPLILWTGDDASPFVIADSAGAAEKKAARLGRSLVAASVLFGAIGVFLFVSGIRSL
ncbi:MAG: GIDE domain-containing protein [Thermoplasmatota archaeon]